MTPANRNTAPGFACPPGRLLLTPGELAALLSVSYYTLKDWRKQGRGPSFMKLERRLIRYPRAAVLAWLQSSVCESAPSRRALGKGNPCRRLC